jgi:hypothetical protein
MPPRRKKAAEASDDDDKAPPASGVRIYWDKDSTRTDRLLDWLDENPVDRQKLFSDSSHDARVEGRKRRVAKGAKSAFYAKIAEAVFSVDAKADVRNDFNANPEKYNKSVENRISMYVLLSKLE